MLPTYVHPVDGNDCLVLLDFGTSSGVTGVDFRFGIYNLKWTSVQEVQEAKVFNGRGIQHLKADAILAALSYVQFPKTLVRCLIFRYILGEHLKVLECI